jgi:hypothetical protein
MTHAAPKRMTDATTVKICPHQKCNNKKSELFFHFFVSTTTPCHTSSLTPDLPHTLLTPDVVVTDLLGSAR